MKTLPRFILSMFLLVVLAFSEFEFMATLGDRDVLRWRALFGAVAVACFFALRRCGARLKPELRSLALALLFVFAVAFGAVEDLRRKRPKSPTPAPVLYKAHYVMGFRMSREDLWNGRQTPIGAEAEKLAEEAVLTYHGKGPPAVKAGGRDGALAGLSSKGPRLLPYWVRATYPAIETEWRQLAQELKAVGRDLKHIEDLRARTEALQSKLEALTKERPDEDREMLDASGDKMSQLAVALRRRLDEVEEEKRANWNWPPE